MMYDTTFECESKKINGLILLVDFEKAFDSLSWKYIHDSLTKFNLGPNFIKMDQTFPDRFILNGHLSNSYELQRCRRVDPISPYLFILCSEFLTLALKEDRQLKGIDINNKERKCSQYADDTSVFLKATEENLKHCLSIMNWFYHVSGLKMNIQKKCKTGVISDTHIGAESREEPSSR